MNLHPHAVSPMVWYVAASLHRFGKNEVLDEKRRKNADESVREEITDIQSDIERIGTGRVYQNGSDNIGGQSKYSGYNLWSYIGGTVCCDLLSCQQRFCDGFW